MTSEEADEIIAQMRSGGGFSDDDGDYFTSYTYNVSTGKFEYMHAWVVIGSVLGQAEYTEQEFKAMLMKDFTRHELNSWTWLGKKASPTIPVRTPPVIKETEAPPSLTVVCRRGEIDTARAMVAAGADVNQPDTDLVTPLSAACNSYVRASVGPLVKLLLENGAKVPPQQAGEDGLIHHAATAGSLETVEALVQRGVSVNIPGAYKRTPLMYAATDGKSPELVAYLIHAGADVNAKHEGGENVLYEMATRGDVNIEIARLIIDAGIDLAYKHQNYGTALSWAANCGCTELVRLLIERGADTNAGAEKKESPMAQAMMGGHHEIVKMLFAAGADAGSRNYGGWSLLEYATEKKDEELVAAILARQKQGGKAANPEAMVKAAQQGDLSMLKLLLKAGLDIDSLSSWGRETPLMKAAYYGKTDAAAWLLDHGAQIEARDSRGNTALLHAAWTGKLDVTKLLLERGADVNAVNGLNWNALMQAALEGHADVAKVLLKHGSRTDLIDKEKGATAYYLAQRSGSKDILEALKAAGAGPRQWRELRPGEPYADIRDCEYCRYIPQGKDLANAESLGDYPGLVQLHTTSSEVDRYATQTYDVLQCKLCGTFYQHDYYIDTEDAFVAGPHISRHLQRFNFERLKIALRDYNLGDQARDFSARLPQLLVSMKEALAREGSEIHPHFLPYFVENVTDTYVLADDWPGLMQNLLKHKDMKIAVQVAHDLVTIFGDGKYASAGAEQVYKAYRHITPELFAQTQKMLKEHRKEFKDFIKAMRASGEEEKAVQELLESVQYYKI